MACAGGTSAHGHPEGETRECSRTVRPCLTGEFLMLRDEGGGGVPLRRGRWLSMAVKGRHGCQRPPKQRTPPGAGNTKTPQ